MLVANFINKLVDLDFMSVTINSLVFSGYINLICCNLVIIQTMKLYGESLHSICLSHNVHLKDSMQINDGSIHP